MDWVLQPQQHHWRCDCRIDTHDGTADHLRRRGDNLEGIIWMTRIMLTAYGMDGQADFSFSFLRFPLLFCFLFTVYICCIVMGVLGWVSIIALLVWRWVRGCFLAFSLGFSREENGMGNREGEGKGDGRSRFISFLSILYLTIRFWIPVFHLYPVFTLPTLSCFGGFLSTHFTNHLALPHST
jgi:hypothetical protein